MAVSPKLELSGGSLRAWSLHPLSLIPTHFPLGPVWVDILCSSPIWTCSLHVCSAHLRLLFSEKPPAPRASPQRPGGLVWSCRRTRKAECTNTTSEGATIFGDSSHGELKTLAIIVDAVNDTHEQPRDHAHHVWVVVDAAVNFQMIRKLARQPLHKATNSSLGEQTLHLWAALRRLPKHVILHLIKQESHRYSLGNGHIDLHTHKQLAEHMPDGEDPPLQDHMHTHLQHLPPIPHPGEPPAWVPDDRIYNDTRQAYHYPKPIRTMAHIQGSHADNTLINQLQHKLHTAL